MSECNEDYDGLSSLGVWAVEGRDGRRGRGREGSVLAVRTCVLMTVNSVLKCGESESTLRVRVSYAVVCILL